MNFNQAKIISVYYNKGDRKPYDVNGKPIAYIGEEFIGSTEATTIRFYLGEDIDSSTATIVTKRADGEKRLDICSKVGSGATSYYEVTLNEWYSAVKGKLVVVFKAYNGTVTFDDNENPTEILSVSGRIVVSDIFNLDIGYAPVADLVVPADDTEPYEDWFFALSTKLDKADSITVAGALPTLTGDAYDDRYFYIEDEGVGRLYYINGSTAEEVVFQVGTLKVTPSGNGEVSADTGKVVFNQPNGTFRFGLYNSQYTYLNQDMLYYGKASGAITKGQAIQFAGVQGDHFLIKPAVPSEINANPELIMGIAKQDISNNEFGYVTSFGKIEDFNTDGKTVGQYLWFASGGVVDGELTTTQPTAPYAKVLLGVVVKEETSGASNNGVILVRVTFEPTLEQLQNVYVTSIADNQILRWNSANSRWENSSELTTAETDIDNLEGRMDTAESDIDSLESRMTTAENDIDDIEDGTTVVPKALADQNGDVINTTYLRSATASSTYIPLSQKGVANGVVPLGSNGKVPSQYLSGEQDDLAEYDSLEDFPEVGETDILYVALDTNKLYRWSGSAYVVISETLALGTTSTTAFRGDLGQTAYDNADTALNNTLNIIDGTQTLTDTRVTNSATNVVPLIVNTVASLTANLQEWKINGSDKAFLDSAGYFRSPGIRSSGSTNNSQIDTATTGTTISRNVADANPSLIVNLANASSTGDILRLQFAGANKLEITKDGFINQNGTRLFTQTGDSTNTFFGLFSGGTSTTGTLNTGFGRASLNSLTTGSSNTSFGRNSLFSLTTGSNNIGLGVNTLNLITNGLNNTAVGHLSGSSLTGGASDNTFLGRDSGNNASQLATASNSTAIGYQSYTDKSNQMVFGNAGVTEFKFDRNASSKALFSQIGIGTTSPQGNLHINSTNTESILHMTNTTSGAAITDGLRIGAIGNNALFLLREAGSMSFATSNTEKVRIDSAGNVGIGTSSPASLLSLRSSGDTYLTIDTNLNANNAGIRLSESSTPTTNGAELVYDGSANLFHIKTGGASFTERLTIVRDSGNVGIGTSSPDYRLDVASGDIRVQNGGNVALAGGSINFNAVANALPMAQIKGLLGFSGSPSGVSQDQGNLAIYTRPVTGNNENLVERMRILGSGLVGINETSPSAQLQVKSGATNRIPLIVDIVENATASLQEFRNNGTTVARINRFGAFHGIQVENVNSSNNSAVALANTGTTISRNIADTNPALIVNLANSSATGNIQVWQKSGTAVATIDGFGNITGTNLYTNNLINISSGNNSRVNLTSTGTVISRNQADSNSALTVNLANASATGNIQVWQKGGSAKAYITNSGGIELRDRVVVDEPTAQEAFYLFDSVEDLFYVESVDGDVYNKNGTYGTISDLRLKENIVQARDYTEDLMKLNVVKYSFKKDHSETPTHLGFIAQEVEEVFPRLVETKKTKELEDMKQIKMSVLIPMLVKTIQELNKRVEELEAK